ncbi:diguanylate cyclase [uncultured Selenomonas sp.]|uniref:GGDEF domain-containing protein n=1 Tax=uncultured Selenomonas sp. TaxID=159275 RepID=UPI0025DC0E88|nr:GGDEF domain-containing protein [uncultured Selenomonas sp.]
MKKLWPSLVLLVTFFLSPVAAEAATADLWLYRESAEPVSEEQSVVWAWSAMAQDEHWGIFDFPKRPPTHEESRTVWLTTRLSAEAPEKDTLFFTTTGESVRVYLDDQIVEEAGAFAPTYAASGWRWHFIQLPGDGHEHQLTIACYSPFPRELGRLYNLSIDTATVNAANVFLLDTSFILALPVAVAMFIVVLFFYVRERMGRHLYRALLVFLGVFICWTFSALQSKFLLVHDAEFWWYVLTLMAYLLPVAANYIIYEILDGSRKTGVLWIIRGYLLLMASAIVAEFLGWHGMKNLMPLYYVFLVIYEPVVFYWTLRAAREGSRYSKAALAPIAAFTGLGVIDGINTFWHFLPTSIYLSPFGIFALAAFLLAVMRDFVVREEQLDAQADSFADDIAAAHAREEYDTLTHCLSRTMYAPLLSGTIRDARVKRQPFSVLMFDIDHFKTFNDTYGHEAGDEVLAGFAAAIRRELKENQAFLRWGGEEFIVLLPDCSLASATQFAEHLRSRIATISLHARQVTTSIGVATWHGAGDTKEKLFERVDGALYRAKEGGRNRVEKES